MNKVYTLDQVTFLGNYDAILFDKLSYQIAENIRSGKLAHLGNIQYYIIIKPNLTYWLIAKSGEKLIAAIKADSTLILVEPFQ